MGMVLIYRKPKGCIGNMEKERSHLVRIWSVHAACTCWMVWDDEKVDARNTSYHDRVAKVMSAPQDCQQEGVVHFRMTLIPS